MRAPGPGPPRPVRFSMQSNIYTFTRTHNSEEELREAVANADAHNGASGNGGNDGNGGGRENGRTRGEEEGGEEWDCHFTDLAVLTYPKGQPEGDPSKVNEYEFEKYLGAGAFTPVLILQCHVWEIGLHVAASCPGFFLMSRPNHAPHSCTPLAGSFGSVRLARRVVTGEAPPYKEYAVKALSKQRLRRMKKSVVTGADGRMVVKTGEDMVSAVGGCGAVDAHWGNVG